MLCRPMCQENKVRRQQKRTFWCSHQTLNAAILFTFGTLMCLIESACTQLAEFGLCSAKTADR